MATTATPGRVTAPSHRQLRSRACAVTAAVLAALLVWSVAVPLLGVDLTVRPTPGNTAQTIGPAFVLAVSLLAPCWAGAYSPGSSDAPIEPAPSGRSPPVSCCWGR